METKLSTGTAAFDWLLEGGYERDCITTIYGPAGSGKTNFCLVAAAHTPKGKKTIYIDTEGSFSIARFKQICPDYEDVLERIVILQPTDFKEQQEAFIKLKDMVNDTVHLIILDSVAMLYRLELGQTTDIPSVNRQLGTQLAYLTQVARKKHLPVLVTNQVYADFEEKDKVKMVGGDLLKYASKCLVELEKIKNGRVATLRKHRSIEDGKNIMFKISDKGVEESGQE